MYDNVTRCLTDASNPLFTLKRGTYTCRPGWTDHVADIHTAANEAFQLWDSTGKPKQGPGFELKRKLMLDTNMQ